MTQQQQTMHQEVNIETLRDLLVKTMQAQGLHRQENAKHLGCIERQIDRLDGKVDEIDGKVDEILKRLDHKQEKG
ncbi:MAG: hypothetical protein OXI94_05330 [Gemmatimonadota bacterium]|nr:hypothetical protein [Gemmatimonadota bacterium]